MLRYTLLCCSIILFFSCKTDQSKTAAPVVTKTSKYTLTVFEGSTEFPDAQINSYTYKEGVFDFKVAEGSYVLGQQTPDAESKMCANSGKGQHIHLIVDNAPYAAKYVPTFKYDIPDGEHYLLAFLSRSYHESIKTSDAHVAHKVMVENNNITGSTDIKKPMLFYSRPKGTYVGDDTKKVMLDFYTINLELGDKYKVKANINGEISILDAWQPYYIEGLPMGENTVELSLVDEKGALVDTPLNPVSRTFTLKEALEPKK